jgi:hypothetical protein
MRILYAILVESNQRHNSRGIGLEIAARGLPDHRAAHISHPLPNASVPGPAYCPTWRSVIYKADIAALAPV